MKARIAVLVADGEPDSQGTCYLGKGVELPEAGKDVPVLLEFNQSLAGTLGRATLERDGHVIFANIELADHLLPPHAPRILYPSVGGVVVERDGSVIKQCKVRSIGLCITPNPDKRIQTLMLQGVPDNVRAKRQTPVPPPGSDVAK